MRKSSFLFLIVAMLFSLVIFPNSSLAQVSESDEDQDVDYLVPPEVDLSEDDTMYEEEVDPSKPTLFAPTVRSYKIVKKTDVGYGYGAFREGPSGRGPGRLNINESTRLDRSYTNSISGDYPVGKGKIALSLGTTIGVSKTYGTTYSIDLNSKRKQIIYRPRYKKVQVKQRLYVNGTATSTYKYATVKVFNNWDYDWKYIK